jgi:hypothetical protein
MREATSTRAGWLIVAALSIAACTFEVPVPDRLRCTSDDDCRRFGRRCQPAAPGGAGFCCLKCGDDAATPSGRGPDIDAIAAGSGAEPASTTDAREDMPVPQLPPEPPVASSHAAAAGAVISESARYRAVRGAGRPSAGVVMSSSRYFAIGGLAGNTAN